MHSPGKREIISVYGERSQENALNFKNYDRRNSTHAYHERKQVNNLEKEKEFFLPNSFWRKMCFSITMEFPGTA